MKDATRLVRKFDCNKSRMDRKYHKTRIENLVRSIHTEPLTDGMVSSNTSSTLHDSSLGSSSGAEHSNMFNTLSEGLDSDNSANGGFLSLSNFDLLNPSDSDFINILDNFQWSRILSDNGGMFDGEVVLHLHAEDHSEEVTISPTRHSQPEETTPGSSNEILRLESNLHTSANVMPRIEEEEIGA